jgi:hypothetical protein
MARTRCCFAGHDRPRFFTDRVIEWLPVFTPRRRRRACSTPWTWLQANAGQDLGAQSAQDRRATAGAVSQGRSKPGSFACRWSVRQRQQLLAQGCRPRYCQITAAPASAVISAWS